MRPIVAAVIAALNLTSAQAANVDWVGLNGGFWEIAGNWNPGLPGIGSDVILGAFDTTFRINSVAVNTFNGRGLLASPVGR